MQLTQTQLDHLKQLMANSAKKGNLANSGMVIEGDKTVKTAESLVVSNHDTTAHSERMLVEQVCKERGTNYTPGLIMVTVCEPCLMCLSACSQAGYKQLAYIIPAERFVEKIPWMSDNTKVDKQKISQTMSDPIELIHLVEYEEEFAEVFETVMADLLK